MKNNMHRVILINAYKQTVTEVQLDRTKGIEDIYRLLRTDNPAPIHCFTCVGLNGEGETAYVDDEGMLTISEQTMFMVFKDYPSPIVGNAVIIGTGPDGDGIPCGLSLQQVKDMFIFQTLTQVREGVAQGKW